MKCCFVAWKRGWPWKFACYFFVKINSLLFILLCAWSLFPRSITNKTGKLTVQGMNDSECHGSGTMRTVQWARARITSNDSVQYIYISSTFPKTWVWIKSEHLAVKTNPALMKALDPTWSISVYQKTIVSWTPLGGIVTIGNNYLVLMLPGLSLGAYNHTRSVKDT